jgi:hypothetical protein
MKSLPWAPVSVAVLIVTIALTYIADPIVPIFLLAVLGLPAAAFLLNRSPRG